MNIESLINQVLQKDVPLDEESDRGFIAPDGSTHTAEDYGLSPATSEHDDIADAMWKKHKIDDPVGNGFVRYYQGKKNLYVEFNPNHPDAMWNAHSFIKNNRTDHQVDVDAGELNATYGPEVPTHKILQKIQSAHTGETDVDEAIGHEWGWITHEGDKLHPVFVDESHSSIAERHAHRIPTQNKTIDAYGNALRSGWVRYSTGKDSLAIHFHHHPIAIKNAIGLIQQYKDHEVYIDYYKGKESMSKGGIRGQDAIRAINKFSRGEKIEDKDVGKSLSQDVGVYEPKSDIESDSGYVYHATNVDGAQAIAQSKKLLTFRPWHGTDQDSWPDGSTEKRSYWSEHAHITHSFVPEGKGAILRAKMRPEMKREGYTGDVYSNKHTPTKDIEILGANKQWYPLDNFFNTGVQETKLQEEWGWISHTGEDLTGEYGDNEHGDIVNRHEHKLTDHHGSEYDRAFNSGWVRYSVGDKTLNLEFEHHPASVHNALDMIHQNQGKHIYVSYRKKNGAINKGYTNHREAMRDINKLALKESIDEKAFILPDGSGFFTGTVGTKKKKVKEDVDVEAMIDEVRRMLVPKESLKARKKYGQEGVEFGWISHTGKLLKGEARDVHPSVLLHHEKELGTEADFEKKAHYQVAAEKGWVRYIKSPKGISLEFSTHPTAYENARKYLSTHHEDTPVALDIYGPKVKDHYTDQHENISKAIKALDTHEAGGNPKVSITAQYREALDEAVEWGWITHEGENLTAKSNEQSHRGIVNSNEHKLTTRGFSPVDSALRSGWVRYFVTPEHVNLEFHHHPASVKNAIDIIQKNPEKKVVVDYRKGSKYLGKNYNDSREAIRDINRTSMEEAISLEEIRTAGFITPEGTHVRVDPEEEHSDVADRTWGVNAHEAVYHKGMIRYSHTQYPYEDHHIFNAQFVPTRDNVERVMQHITKHAKGARIYLDLTHPNGDDYDKVEHQPHENIGALKRKLEPHIIEAKDSASVSDSSSSELAGAYDSWFFKPKNEVIDVEEMIDEVVKKAKINQPDIPMPIDAQDVREDPRGTFGWITHEGNKILGRKGLAHGDVLRGAAESGKLTRPLSDTSAVPLRHSGVDLWATAYNNGWTRFIKGSGGVHVDFKHHPIAYKNVRAFLKEQPSNTPVHLDMSKEDYIKSEFANSYESPDHALRDLDTLEAGGNPHASITRQYREEYEPPPTETIQASRKYGKENVKFGWITHEGEDLKGEPGQIHQTVAREHEDKLTGSGPTHFEKAANSGWVRYVKTPAGLGLSFRVDHPTAVKNAKQMLTKHDGGVQFDLWKGDELKDEFANDYKYSQTAIKDLDTVASGGDPRRSITRQYRESRLDYSDFESYAAGKKHGRENIQIGWITHRGDDLKGDQGEIHPDVAERNIDAFPDSEDVDSVSNNAYTAAYRSGWLRYTKTPDTIGLQFNHKDPKAVDNAMHFIDKHTGNKKVFLDMVRMKKDDSDYETEKGGHYDTPEAAKDDILKTHLGRTGTSITAQYREDVEDLISSILEGKKKGAYTPWNPSLETDTAKLKYGKANVKSGWITHEGEDLKAAYIGQPHPYIARNNKEKIPDNQFSKIDSFYAALHAGWIRYTETPKTIGIHFKLDHHGAVDNAMKFIDQRAQGRKIYVDAANNPHEWTKPSELWGDYDSPEHAKKDILNKHLGRAGGKSITAQYRESKHPFFGECDMGAIYIDGTHLKAKDKEFHDNMFARHGVPGSSVDRLENGWTEYVVMPHKTILRFNARIPEAFDNARRIIKEKHLGQEISAEHIGTLHDEDYTHYNGPEKGFERHFRDYVKEPVSSGVEPKHRGFPTPNKNLAVESVVDPRILYPDYRRGNSHWSENSPFGYISPQGEVLLPKGNKHTHEAHARELGLKNEHNAISKGFIKFIHKPGALMDIAIAHGHKNTISNLEGYLNKHHVGEFVNVDYLYKNKHGEYNINKPVFGKDPKEVVGKLRKQEAEYSALKEDIDVESLVSSVLGG